MTYTIKYTLFGVIFGMCFPLIATFLDVWLSSGTLSIDGIILSQLNNPLMWMIDTAPFFLGLFACMGGVQYDKLIASESEKQKLNEMLEAQNKELEDKVHERTIQLESNIKKLVSLSQIRSEFIATVSHELRTPLTAINGAIKLIKSNAVGEINEKGLKLIQLADRNVNLLTCLVNDILDIEKIDSGKIEFEKKQYSVLDLVKTAIDMSQPYAESFNVELVVAEFDSSVKLLVDKRRFIQVMLNLISNACKFSPSKSEIKVKIMRREKYIRINVEDSGEGIPGNLKDKIFCKFVQGDSSNQRSRNGTGLGLNISKSLAVCMGGKIGFHPNKEKGTVFYLDFEESL